MEMLPEYLKAKEKNYKIYKDEIDKIPALHQAEVPGYAKSNYWFYSLQIDKEIYGMGREKLMTHLQQKGIQARPAWYPNHLQKPYNDCQNYKIEKAFQLLDKTLNIPCSVNLTDSDIEKVISLLR